MGVAGAYRKHPTNVPNNSVGPRVACAGSGRAPKLGTEAGQHARCAVCGGRNAAAAARTRDHATGIVGMGPILARRTTGQAVPRGARRYLARCCRHARGLGEPGAVAFGGRVIRTRTPQRLPRNRIHATPGPRQHGATGTGTGTGTGTVAQDDAAAREQRGAVRPPKRMASPGGSPIRPEGLRGKLRRRGATPACALPTRGKWAATNASAGGHRPCSQAQPPRLLPPVPSLPTFPTASLDLTSDLISLVRFPGTCTAACCHNGVVGRFVGRFTPGAGSAGRIARTVQRSSGVWA